MNSQELRNKALDYRRISDVYEDCFPKMEKMVDVLEQVNLVAGDDVKEGLRVRVYFNLTEDERELIDEPPYECINFQQGMLYYPTDGDWWEEDSVHLQYRIDELSDEEHNQHQIILKVLHKVFWLAYDLD